MPADQLKQTTMDEKKRFVNSNKITRWRKREC